MHIAQKCKNIMDDVYNINQTTVFSILISYIFLKKYSVLVHILNSKFV